MSGRRLGLFQGFGVELEYMIVDRSTLDVRPLADRVLAAVAGEPVSEVELGELAWCNELVLHVLEMKTNGPATTLRGLGSRFQEHVERANGLLATLDAALLPSAMHPWMDPQLETRLWPHEQNGIYRAYDRIFGCKGHGWSNLQSTHINLPFADDREFVLLHSAIRIVLALVPSLAASSPLQDGRLSGLVDTRLEHYRHNQRAVPSLTGRVIPEVVRSIAEYRHRILARLYEDIAPHDPDRILRHEWLNSRGAIARFDRGAIEIRVVDIQECAAADLAVVALIVATVRALAEGRWVAPEALHEIPLEALEEPLLRSIAEGTDTVIEGASLLAALGEQSPKPIAARELWGRLAAELLAPADLRREGWGEALEAILGEGTLAQRIRTAVGPDPDRERIRVVYRRLMECLSRGELFHA